MDQPRETDGWLTTEQLAEATATAAETLRHWQSLGLLAGDGGSFPPEAIERVRVIEFIARRGVSAEAVARACEAQGDLIGDHVEELLGRARPRQGRPLAEAAVAVGLDPAILARLWVAGGLGDQDEVYDEDIESLQRLGMALGAGLPEDALTQIVRVYADALGRVADAEVRLFHYYVHERLRAEGLAGRELADATQAVGQPLMGLIEPTVAYFHRKAFQHAQREDLVLHVTEATTPVGEVPGEVDVAILFADLSGFTPLTEAMGDAAAAGVMERFSDLVRTAARQHHGKVVKQIGDEFMLAFTDPASAVACGVDIDAAASAEAQFPALRLGAHAGTVLYREGDYLGATVNVAARVVAEADRQQFLVTVSVREATDGLAGVELVPVGVRDLKGVPGSFELFEARPLGDRPRRTIDPVCLMELDPASVAARLTWRDADLLFCSDACLQLFVAAPEDYSA
jgi:adenylate cyclase